MDLRWLVLATMLLSVPFAHATKLYKWVDKDGRVTYHDRPPPSDAYRVEEKYIGVRRPASADRIPPEVLEKYPVVLYSAPKCSSCDSARAYLKSRGIPFTEKNVEGNRELQDELIKQAGGLAVPTIMVGSKVMQGYLESLLEGELKEAGYPMQGAATANAQT
ncbi:MAG TPA: glutaredoxin family protein, partial [Burkholderiales bacterium]